MPAQKRSKDAPARPSSRASAAKRPAAGSRSAAAQAVPPDRRTNILLAAEKLFATRGFHAVSIRDIAAEAAVPLALVGYYYGAKHELYHAIFQSWSPVIAGRLEALGQAGRRRPAGAAASPHRRGLRHARWSTCTSARKVATTR